MLSLIKLYIKKSTILSKHPSCKLKDPINIITLIIYQELKVHTKEIIKY